jgi:hypothetical protein
MAWKQRISHNPVYTRKISLCRDSLAESLPRFNGVVQDLLWGCFHHLSSITRPFNTARQLWDLQASIGASASALSQDYSPVHFTVQIDLCNIFNGNRFLLVIWITRCATFLKSRLRLNSRLRGHWSKLVRIYAQKNELHIALDKNQ